MKCFPALRFLALLFLPAAASTAALVTVVSPANSTAPGFADISGFPVAPSDLHFRVGYFMHYSLPGFSSAFFQAQPAVKQMIDEYFIPLGEPGAPILQSLGMDTAQLGSPSTVSASLLPSGYYGAAGAITSAARLLNFVSAPANSPNLLGVPYGSRLFLIAYSGVDWTSATALAVVGGAPAAPGTWQVPTIASFSTSALLMQQVDTPAEVFYGFYNGPSISLVPYIPEPGAATLTAGVLLASFTGRRRESRRC